MADVTAEEINELMSEGLSKKEAGEKLGISAQKVGSILAKADTELLSGEVMDGRSASEFAKTFNRGDITENENITIFTAQEYTDYSAANGRFQGRKKGQKTKCSIEELRALINSGLKPKYIMNKHGIDKEEFKQLIWKLSEKELRAKPLKFDIDQDYIQVG